MDKLYKIVVIVLTFYSITLFAASGADTNSDERINKINAIMIGCELNGTCMLTMMEKIAQSEPNSFYDNILASLKAQRDLFEFNDRNCNGEDVKAVKKETAACIKEVMEGIDKAPQETNQMVSSLNACITSRMEILAKSQNIFAQSMLANHAQKAQDKQAMNRWNDEIKKQQGTPSYEQYVLCSKQFQLIPAGINLGNNGKKG